MPDSAASPSRLATLRFLARHRALNSVALGPTYVRLRPAYAPERLGPHTRLVVEGFPRSANSYARYALHVSQDQTSFLAGHHHSAATVRTSVGRGLATVVIVRNPDAAVASLLQAADPPISPWAAFWAYSRFHRTIMPVAHRLLLVSFETVIQDFPRVIDEINAKFELGLNGLSTDETTTRRISDLVEGSNEALSGGAVDERSVARPSPGRKSATSVLAGLSRRDQKARAFAALTYGDISRRLL